MKVADNTVVSIHYTLTSVEGEQIDSSAGKEPLRFLAGAGNIIPGLEKELHGAEAGEKKQVTVEPEEGYGEVMPQLIQVLPAEAFTGVDEVKVGMEFQAKGADGSTQYVVVKDVGDDGVTIDANHPLAGQTLNFDVSVEEVREATDEEKEHGHVH